MKIIDESGNTYGRLRVLERYDPEKHGKMKTTTAAYWVCECSCGNIAIVSGVNLRTGGTRSCGCLRQECMSVIGRSKKKARAV